MAIYAYENIPREEIVAKRTTKGGKEYALDHSEKLAVPMKYVGLDKKSGRNSQGWERSHRKYFSTLKEQHPDAFSKKNLRRMNEGHVPEVDEKFAKYFGIDKVYLGEELRHQHIGGDGQAVAVPLSVHSDGYGEIHNVEQDVGVRNAALQFSDRCAALCQKYPEYLGKNADELKEILGQQDRRGGGAPAPTAPPSARQAATTPGGDANVIPQDKIKVNSPYPIYEIYDIKITHEINEHAKLYLKALLEEEEPAGWESCIQTTNEKDEVQVIIQSDAGEEILFTGAPWEIKINMVQNLRYIELECYSGTANMDVHEVSRSFQDKGMKYDDMFGFVIKDYDKADFINTAAKDMEIGRPVIQYHETDWEFFKRMAASEGTVLTADVTTSAGKLWLGIPEAIKTVSVKNKVPTRRERAETIEQKACFYYEIELADYLKVGDIVNLDGFDLTVTKSLISYDKGVICNTYRIQKSPEMNAYSNEKIKGVSLEGTVIDVSLNHLKIHLDIDPEQKVEEAFWYPCVAEANNVWYTMPHKGERINLHIADSAETGLCMTNARGKNGEMATTKSMSKPTEKYMETKWDKRLTLHEGDIEVDIPTVNIKMDEESIYVTSNDKITVGSDTDINIGKSVFKYYEKNGTTNELTKETKYISVEADELVTMKVTKTESVIELDEDNNLHTRRDVKVYGTNKSPTPLVFSAGRLGGK